MQTLTESEINEVAGGMTGVEGAAAILGLAATAAASGALFATGFGFVIGATLLYESFK